MKKRKYGRPEMIVFSLSSECVCLVNSGTTGGVVPAMPWDDDSGGTSANVPGMSWEQGSDWQEYEATP